MRRAGRQFLQVVGDDDGRQCGLARAQVIDARQQLLAPGQVEAGGWLVEQQHARLPDQGPRDQRAAALTLGQDRPPRAGQRAQAHHLDGRVGAGQIGRAGRPARHQVDRAGRAGEHDVTHGPAVRHRMMRGHQADQRAQREDVHPPEPLPEDVDLSAGRMRVGREQAQQRALAGSVRPEQRPDLAGPHGQRDLVEQQAPATYQVDRVGSQDGVLIGGGDRLGHGYLALGLRRGAGVQCARCGG